MGGDWWVADEPYPGPDTQPSLFEPPIVFADFINAIQKVGSQRPIGNLHSMIRGFRGLNPIHTWYDEEKVYPHTAREVLLARQNRVPNTGPRCNKTYDHRGRRRN